MHTAAIIAGAAIVLVALLDVFMTVLYVRIGVGLLTPSMYRLTWEALKVVSRRAGSARQTVLSFAGPSMMVLSVMLWLSLLLLGFGLIAWPMLGTDIVASSGATPTSFAAAVYYAGYSLTTLGTGDLVPATGLARLIMVLQAVIGFSVVTLALTYFMSVYAAFVRRNTLAQMLHHLTGGTREAVEIVIGIGVAGFDSARSELMEVGTAVLNLLESHRAYPILHYFRMSDPRFATSTVANLTLETATLIRTALGESEDAFKRSAVVNLLWGSGHELLRQATDDFLGDGAGASPNLADAPERFDAAVAALAGAGIAVATDRSARDRYVALRGEWVGRSFALATAMAHRWADVEVPLAEHGGTAAA